MIRTGYIRGERKQMVAEVVDRENDMFSHIQNV